MRPEFQLMKYLSMVAATEFLRKSFYLTFGISYVKILGRKTGQFIIAPMKIPFNCM